MSRMLTQAQWTARIGEIFEISLAGQTVSLRLAVVSTGNSRPGPSREAFSLEFTGPLNSPLPQATYLFGHPEFGQFPVFMVPVARNKEGFTYEAVFN